MSNRRHKFADPLQHQLPQGLRAGVVGVLPVIKAKGGPPPEVLPRPPHIREGLEVTPRLNPELPGDLAGLG